jgi:hypothetical protein
MLAGRQRILRCGANIPGGLIGTLKPDCALKKFGGIHFGYFRKFERVFARAYFSWPLPAGCTALHGDVSPWRETPH